MAKTSLGREGFVPPFRLQARGSQGRSLKQKRPPLTVFLPLVCRACFLSESRTTCSGATAHRGLGLLHKISTKKTRRRLGHGVI